MKHIEYFAEFSRLIKIGDAVGVIDLVLKNPFLAQKSIHNAQWGPEIRKNLSILLEKDEFLNRYISKSYHEFLSLAPHILPETFVKKRLFAYVFCDWGSVDFVTQKGLIQAKTKENVVEKDFWQNVDTLKRKTTNFQIITQNNPFAFTQQRIEHLNCSIVYHSQIPKMNLFEIEQLRKQVIDNIEAYGYIKHRYVAPLINSHTEIMLEHQKNKCYNIFEISAENTREDKQKKEFAKLFRNTKQILSEKDIIIK